MIRIASMVPQPVQYPFPPVHIHASWCWAWLFCTPIECWPPSKRPPERAPRRLTLRAPPGPGPCMGAVRRAGVWWWVYREETK